MKSPVRLCFLLAWIALTLPAAALAADPAAAQLEQLQREIGALKARVTELERRLDQGVAVNPALQVEPAPGGWRNAENWALLARDLEAAEVRRILGEPDNTRTVKKFEYWEYGDGKARLYLNRLKSWEPPTSTGQ